MSMQQLATDLLREHLEAAEGSLDSDEPDEDRTLRRRPATRKEPPKPNTTENGNDEPPAKKIPFVVYSDLGMPRPIPSAQSPLYSERGRGVADGDPSALLFDQFCNANTFQGIVGTFQQMCDLAEVQPADNQGVFYHRLKQRLSSWKAQSLWTKLDKRASQREYRKGQACANTNVLVIGAGPCGLRVAIEVALLGGRAVIVEKRDRLTRNNVLHLWPFLITDLKALGAKKFFGKFCAGSIDHISIRTLQCILLKVALLVGVEIHAGVTFEDLKEPPPVDEDAADNVGWRASVSPSDHPVSEYNFDVLVGADGKRNTLTGWKRKEFRGKLAIAITANFINRKTNQEARVEEISGVAYIFNQKFFKDLNAKTGIDLENIVYYKDETHYFVMTAKKHSLLLKGVLIQDYEDATRLLDKRNVNQEALLAYAVEAADVSTRNLLPSLDFAHNHYGQPDVAMFDFTSMFAAEHASRVIERNGQRLLMALVGDSLLEPFWPTGSGCARGFLGCMDTAWMIRSWVSERMTPLEVLAERESIYQLLSQTTPENINKNFSQYSIDPNTRYPNLNLHSFKPQQMKQHYDGQDLAYLNEIVKLSEANSSKYEWIRDSHNLLKWFQRQLEGYRNLVKILDLTSSWRNGIALAALIHQYRPELIDVYTLDCNKVASNVQRVFDVAEKEFGITAPMTGEDMAHAECPDKHTMVSYLSQFYEYFRKESIKPTKVVQKAIQIPLPTSSNTTRPGKVKSPSEKRALLNKISNRIRQQRALGPDSDSQDDEEGGKRSHPPTHMAARKHLKEIAEEETNRMSKNLHRFEGLEPFEEKPQTYAQLKKQFQMKELKAGIRGQNKVSALAKDISKKFKGASPEDRARRRELRLQQQVKRVHVDVENTAETMHDKIKGAFPESHARGVRSEVGQQTIKAMAEDMAKKFTGDTEIKKLNPTPLILGQTSSTDLCYFCQERVYLVERHTAEGVFFHRGCFRCDYCSTNLRIGAYAFKKDEDGVSKFYCPQHYGLQRVLRRPRKRSFGEEDVEDLPPKSSVQESLSEGKGLLTPTSPEHGLLRTPERVEYVTESEQEESEVDQNAHNLSGSFINFDNIDGDSSEFLTEEENLGQVSCSSEEWSDDDLSDSDLSWIQIARYTRQMQAKQALKKKKKKRAAEATEGDESTEGKEAAEEDSDTETETATIGASDADWEVDSDLEMDMADDDDEFYIRSRAFVQLVSSTAIPSSPPVDAPRQPLWQPLEPMRRDILQRPIVAPTHLTSPTSYTSLTAPTFKETRPSPTNQEVLKNKMSFFENVSQPIRIDARSFLGLDPPPPLVRAEEPQTVEVDEDDDDDVCEGEEDKEGSNEEDSTQEETSSGSSVTDEAEEVEDTEKKKRRKKKKRQDTVIVNEEDVKAASALALLEASGVEVSIPTIHVDGATEEEEAGKDEASKDVHDEENFPISKTFTSDDEKMVESVDQFLETDQKDIEEDTLDDVSENISEDLLRETEEDNLDVIDSESSPSEQKLDEPMDEPMDIQCDAEVQIDMKSDDTAELNEVKVDTVLGDVQCGDEERVIEQGTGSEDTTTDSKSDGNDDEDEAAFYARHGHIFGFRPPVTTDENTWSSLSSSDHDGDFDDMSASVIEASDLITKTFGSEAALCIDTEPMLVDNSVSESTVSEIPSNDPLVSDPVVVDNIEHDMDIVQANLSNSNTLTRDTLADSVVSEPSTPDIISSENAVKELIVQDSQSQDMKDVVVNDPNSSSLGEETSPDFVVVESQSADNDCHESSILEPTDVQPNNEGDIPISSLPEIQSVQTDSQDKNKSICVLTNEDNTTDSRPEVDSLPQELETEDKCESFEGNHIMDSRPFQLEGTFEGETCDVDMPAEDDDSRCLVPVDNALSCIDTESVVEQQEVTTGSTFAEQPREEIVEKLELPLQPDVCPGPKSSPSSSSLADSSSPRDEGVEEALLLGEPKGLGRSQTVPLACLDDECLTEGLESEMETGVDSPLSDHLPSLSETQMLVAGETIEFEAVVPDGKPQPCIGLLNSESDIATSSELLSSEISHESETLTETEGAVSEGEKVVLNESEVNTLMAAPDPEHKAGVIHESVPDMLIIHSPLQDSVETAAVVTEVFPSSLVKTSTPVFSKSEQKISPPIISGGSPNLPNSSKDDASLLEVDLIPSWKGNDNSPHGVKSEIESVHNCEKEEPIVNIICDTLGNLDSDGDDTNQTCRESAVQGTLADQFVTDDVSAKEPECGVASEEQELSSVCVDNHQKDIIPVSAVASEECHDLSFLAKNNEISQVEDISVLVAENLPHNESGDSLLEHEEGSVQLCVLKSDPAISDQVLLDSKEAEFLLVGTSVKDQPSPLGIGDKSEAQEIDDSKSHLIASTSTSDTSPSSVNTVSKMSSKEAAQEAIKRIDNLLSTLDSPKPKARDIFSSISDTSIEVEDDYKEDLDVSQLVEFTVQDDIGTERSFTVDEKYITKRDSIKKKKPETSGQKTPTPSNSSFTISTPSGSIESTSSVPELHSTSVPASTTEDSLDHSIDRIANGHQLEDSISLDKLVDENVGSSDDLLEDIEIDAMHLSLEKSVTGDQSQSSSTSPLLMRQQKVPAEESILNESSIYYTPNQTPDPTTNGVPHVDPGSRKNLKLTVDITSSPTMEHTSETTDLKTSDALSDGSDQKSVNSQKSPLFSPNRFNDAKRKFYFEAAQPVRIDPSKVFKELPNKSRAQVNNKEVANNKKNRMNKGLEINPQWSGMETKTPTSPTAAIPHCDGASGETDVFYTPSPNVRSGYDETPTDAGHSKDARKRILPSSPSELIRRVTGNRPTSAVTDKKKDKSRIFKRPASAKTESIAISDSSTISSADSPRRPPSASDSASSHSGTSPLPVAKTSRESKLKANKGKALKEDNKENKNILDKREKRRSLLALLMPSKSIDKKDKVKSPTQSDREDSPKQTTKKKSSTPESTKKSTKSPSTEPKSSEILHLRPKSGKSSSKRPAIVEEEEDKRKSIYEEMAPIVKELRVGVSRRKKEDFVERIQQVAPPPAKAPHTALRPPKATMDEFDSESLSEFGDPDKVSLRSFHAQQAMTEEELAKLLRRQQRAVARRHREEELKRLRNAQEIQRQLEEIEIKQRRVEEKGVAIERALRGEGPEASRDEAEVMQEWFNVVHEKNILVRYESELLVHARSLELEDRHSRLEHQLRDLMTLDESERTEEKHEEEERVMQELLEVVEQRDALVALLEEDRVRERAQDRDLNDILSSKGLQWLPSSPLGSTLPTTSTHLHAS